MISAIAIYNIVTYATSIYDFQFLSLPFALNNKHVNDIDPSVTPWLGTIYTHQIGSWIDYAFLLLLVSSMKVLSARERL